MPSQGYAHHMALKDFEGKHVRVTIDGSYLDGTIVEIEHRGFTFRVAGDTGCTKDVWIGLGVVEKIEEVEPQKSLRAL